MSFKIINNKTSSVSQPSPSNVIEKALTITLLVLVVLGAATSIIALNSVGAVYMPYLSYATYGAFSAALLVLCVKVVSMLVSKGPSSIPIHDLSTNPIPSQNSSPPKSSLPPVPFVSTSKSSNPSFTPTPTPKILPKTPEGVEFGSIIKEMATIEDENLFEEYYFASIKTIIVPKPVKDLNIYLLQTTRDRCDDIIQSLEKIKKIEPKPKKPLFVVFAHQRYLVPMLTSIFQDSYTEPYESVIAVIDYKDGKWSLADIDKFKSDLQTAIESFTSPTS